MKVLELLEGDKRSWKVMEGHGRSWKVKKGQGRSWMVFSHHQIDIYVRKVMGGWGGVGWWPEKL